MISSLLLGVASGFVLSMPPGPISLAATRQVLAGFFTTALKIVMAAALMDVVYMLVATFASSAIVVTVSRLVQESLWFPLVFQVLCIIILLVLGITFLLPAKRQHEEQVEEQRERRQEERAKQLGHSSPFFLGLIMAITNLASPAFLPSMVATVGFLQTNRWLHYSVEDNMLFSVGFGTGTFFWFLSAMRLLAFFRTRLSENFINWIYRFAGATLLVFAGAIVVHVALTTEWRALM
ncbi:MAG TPA: LysE family transporter [Bacteroidota bacterium]|nr:LysE family transporter [Bacteroidota bacterium]